MKLFIEQNKKLAKKVKEFATLWVKKRQGTYFICPACEGNGSQKSFIRLCKKCDGRGYIDWIARVKGI